MIAHEARELAITHASDWRDRLLNGSARATERIDEIFGVDVFGQRTMQQRLPKDVYKRLIRTIELGEPLDHQVADVVVPFLEETP